jgi:hypothetical protein
VRVAADRGRRVAAEIAAALVPTENRLFLQVLEAVYAAMGVAVMALGVIELAEG